MRPYQEEYIDNCKRIRRLTGRTVMGADAFDPAFDAAVEGMRRADAIMDENTRLLQDELLPKLDDLYQQALETLTEMEEFADALTQSAEAPDVPLACQIYSALIKGARRAGRREAVIRLLYKLGMARYAVWNTFTGLDIPEANEYAMRMRYCFVEASSYLKYYDEFPEETKGYILRALANLYLGPFPDWRERLDIVRHTMRVFNDPHYRESAPGLPWDVYMSKLHRQMTSVLPYSLGEKSLSPDEVADVMESVHVSYELQYEESRRKGEPIQAHSLVPYYSMEFMCGLVGRVELLDRFEQLMDEADPSRYDENTFYQIISMPAFYVQYLRKMPDLIPSRQGYVTSLYRRMLRYLDDIPQEKLTDHVRLYSRQVLSVFMEVEGGVSYRDMSVAMIGRLAPDLYAQGYVVGKMSEAICRTILDNEPGFFDDIPQFAAMPAGEEKRAAVAAFAYNAGLLHDVGKIGFAAIHANRCRQRMRIEEELLELHTQAGDIRLRQYDSTKVYADIALGHHRWYDGSGGYPEGYRRQESAYRAMVDVVALADFLGQDRSDAEGAVSFDERVERARELDGRRFSPMVVAWLYHQDALLAQLRALSENGLREGYYRCFHGLQDREDA